MSRTDRAIGITLGLVIGVVAVIIFVFTGGAGIDDASLNQGETTSIESGESSGSGVTERPRGAANGASGAASEGPSRGSERQDDEDGSAGLPGEGG